MNPLEHARSINRRTFLSQSAYGLGTMALASLLNPSLARAAEAVALAPSGKWRGVVNPPHFPVKAKRIIHLCMAGGPSHLETFDFKPQLKALDGKAFPASFTQGQQLAQLQNTELKARGPFCEFKQCGQSGAEISSLFPHIQEIADDLCIVRSMHTEQINHDPAHAFFNSGSIIKGRPSMGSWMLYGLGAETEDLPGFVVLTSAGKTGLQPVSARQWSAGFLPSKFQGIQFQSKGDAVHYIGNPDGVCQSTQRQVIEEIQRLNGLAEADHVDPEIATRIAQYELAFKMQTSVPGLLDMSSEPAHILEMYGAKPGDGSFASNCLLARRLAERGVRFIQLYHRDWDHHSDVRNNLIFKAQEVDQATAALITDLGQRGMLDDTLVIWGGEFGRTPMSQGRGGRDHHIKGFSFMLAGAGIKKGLAYGATDDLGYAAIENPVSVHDFHATMLYLLGVDAAKLAVKYQGLDVRLTGPQGGTVVRGILA